MKNTLRWSCALVFGLTAVSCRSPVPQESRTSYTLGLESISVGEVDTAIDQLTTAVDTARPHVYVEALVARGECFLRQGQAESEAVPRRRYLDRATADLHEALTEARLEPAARSHALLLRGTAFEVLGRPEDAKECYRELIALAHELPPHDEQRTARGRLGWLLLQPSLVERSGNAKPTEITEDLRAAQHHFSIGLDLAPNDPDCLLGKGICLYLRGQNRQAIDLLERSTVETDRAGRPNPRGHYYLALALETQHGAHRRVLDNLLAALEHDRARTFTPLYSDFARVLQVYAPTHGARFVPLFRRLLEFEGADREYWTRVDAMATPLLDADVDATRRLGHYACALARARIHTDVTPAVESALELAAMSETKPFLDQLKRVFPARQSDDVDRRLRDYHGRGLTLFRAKLHEELDRVFERESSLLLDEVAASLLPEKRPPNYFRNIVLYGDNVVELWKLRHAVETESDDGTSTNGPDAPADRVAKGLDKVKTFGKALESYQLHLETRPGDHAVRVRLGMVQESLGSFEAAYLSYAYVARSAPDHLAAHARIVSLHESELLPSPSQSDAWTMLQAYTGNDPEITAYVSNTRQRLSTLRNRYCRGCGHRGEESETSCGSCGRLLPVGRPATTSEGSVSKQASLDL